MGDEVRMDVGHLVEVHEIFDDGWALGTNLTTGQQGAFPMGCMVKVEDYDDTEASRMTDAIKKSHRVSSLRMG
jgi:hypothetical protein